MNRFFLLITLGSFAILLSSCATFYTGTRSVVHVNSIPQNAKVYLNSEYVGNTPISFKVKKSLWPTELLVQKDSFVNAEFKLKKEFAPISLLSTVNIWVDVSTGSILKYSDNYYNVELKEKNENINVNKPWRSSFYYINYKGDTVFTAPFYDFKMKRFTSFIQNINYKTINGEKATIASNYVKKIRAMKIVNSRIGLFFLTVQTKTDYHYITYLGVPFFQNEKESRAVLMEELLENGRFHLMKSYFDNNTVSQNGDFKSTNNPVYYLYEDGGKITRIENNNLLNTLVLNFKNESQLILAIKKDCTFKNLEKYIYKNRDSRNTFSKAN